MNNKTIASLLVAGALITGTGFTATALPNTSTSSPTKIVKEVQNHQISNYQEALNTIQNNYLMQEANGTFKINPKANSVIDSAILNQIQASLNFVNQNILAGNVSFKMAKENGKTTVTANKITNTYKNILNEKLQSQNVSNQNTANFSVMVNSNWISNNLYDVTYTWYGGYGFADSAEEIYNLCEANGNGSWANTAYTAWKCGYALTVTFNGIFGFTNVSY